MSQTVDNVCTIMQNHWFLLLCLQRQEVHKVVLLHCLIPVEIVRQFEHIGRETRPTWF